MSFARIQDQDVGLRLLRSIVRSGRIPNGLLFWGPGGVGKRMTAHEFAKAINCKESEDDACDTCLSCRKIDHGNHPDVAHIAPTGKMRTISVKMIKALNETAVFRPYEGGSRIVIITDADRMQEPAQNHFLKTLEEPPSKTTFILLTEWPRHLLPTIRSRCQRVRFGALRPETISGILAQRVNLASETCRALASLSGGSMARALELANTERRAVVMDVIQRLANGEDPLLLNEQFSAHVQNTEKRISTEVTGEKGARETGEEEEGEDAPDKEEIEAHIAGLLRQEMLEHLILFDAWYRDEMIHGMTAEARFVHNRDYAGQLPRTVRMETQQEKLQAIADAWKYIERNMNKTRIFRDLFFALAP